MNSEQLKQLENNHLAAADNLRANTEFPESHCLAKYPVGRNSNG
jgi:hypothetical protein